MRIRWPFNSDHCFYHKLITTTIEVDRFPIFTLVMKGIVDAYSTNYSHYEVILMKKTIRTSTVYIIFFNLYSGGVESNWVHSVLRPPIGLLCQSRVIMMMDKLVEWLARETEVLGENLPQCRFVHHKPHMLPITVADRSKAWTVFASSKAGIVGSNTTRGMDVCLCLC
jgi:hypothetical protein